MDNCRVLANGNLSCVRVDGKVQLFAPKDAADMICFHGDQIKKYNEQCHEE